MLNGDGNEVAGSAKELFPAMMVVLLTSRGIKTTEGDRPATHIDHVLPKPFDLNELRALFPLNPYTRK